MQKQPFTYTLPEQFLTDQAVPTRWRVWAVINGFFISGQKCWASNEWIGEKVGAHKDTVSQAVKELESLKIIRCERGARSRSIFPMIGDSAYQWSASAPISDRHQRLSISVSNSVSEKSVAKATPSYEIVKDQQKVKVVRDNRAMQLRGTLYRMFEKENGVSPVPNQGDYVRVLEALKYLKDTEIIDLVEDALEDGKKKTVREMLSARSIDVYRQENS